MRRHPPPLFWSAENAAEFKKIKKDIILWARDAVNRGSRKPFYWGGLEGRRQLEALRSALDSLPLDHPLTEELRRIAAQVGRALSKTRDLALDVAAAREQLGRIAQCLRYPAADAGAPAPVSSAQVRNEMNQLIAQFKPDLKRQPAQATLAFAWRRVWKECDPALLHCYDVPGLPADNLAIEAFFGGLRSGQRRTNGRKSTAELRTFGQHAVLLTSPSPEALTERLRDVPLELYKRHRKIQKEAEAPVTFLRRLHHDPQKVADEMKARLKNIMEKGAREQEAM